MQNKAQAYSLIELAGCLRCKCQIVLNYLSKQSLRNKELKLCSFHLTA